MILLSVLEHDLHRLKAGSSAAPLWLEEPVPPKCLPALITGSRGNLLTSRRLTKEGRLRVGVFNQDPDRMDDLLEPLFEAALQLSLDEKWPNVFTGRTALADAYAYVKASSPAPGQPHVCLYPRDWDQSDLKKAFGEDLAPNGRYKEYCRPTPAKVRFPVMLSRPDMVGKVSQIMGGKSAIALHNVKLGMGLCPPRRKAG